jgi:hypothetical protein
MAAMFVGFGSIDVMEIIVIAIALCAWKSKERLPTNN